MAGRGVVVVERAFELPGVDPERAWAALTEAEALCAWFAEHAEVELREGGRYAFWGRFTPWTGAAPDGDPRVLAVGPGRTLRFTWAWRGVPGEVTLGVRSGPGGAVFDVRHEVRGALLPDEEETRWAVLDFWTLAAGNLREYLRRGRAALRPDFTRGGPDVELSIEVDAPPERVFAELVEPAGLEGWIAEKAHVDLAARVYSYGWTQSSGGARVPCGPTRVVEVAPGRRLVTDWVHAGEPESRVEWTLAPLDDGRRTRVTLVHRRPAGDAGRRPDYAQGWAAYLVRLAEHGRGAVGAFRLDEAVEVLSRTPATLAALLRGLPEAWTEATEGPGTFSPRDVVGHLLHGERTDWMPRVRRILAEGDRRPFDPFDRRGHEGELSGWTLGSLLDAFAAERAASLAALRALALTEADLDRTGIHPALGRVTLRMLLSTWVVHDLGHVRQACRVLAGRYRSDVGPWTAYLPVLSERGSRRE
jgi:uncharacterized protein YndB with AHSA1/START domain